MSLVGAFAASHAPGITGRPSLPPAAESEPIFRAYAELRSRLEAARPDVLVVVSPEHWANFFLDNMPSFCIGIADEFFGPTDEKFVNIPRRSVRGNMRLARALAQGIAEDVDLSTSQEMAFDHGVMLPLHLLRTELPVIPIIVNCLAGMPAPLHRCHALGVAIRRTVDVGRNELRCSAPAAYRTGRRCRSPDRSESISTGAFSMHSSVDESRVSCVIPKRSSKRKRGRAGTRSAPGLPSPVRRLARADRCSPISLCRLVHRLRGCRVGDRADRKAYF